MCNSRSHLIRKIARRLIRERLLPGLGSLDVSSRLQETRPHQEGGEIERRALKRFVHRIQGQARLAATPMDCGNAKPQAGIIRPCCNRLLEEPRGRRKIPGTQGSFCLPDKHVDIH
jgi:hypothetical protein